MSDIALTVSILALVAVVGLFIGNVKFRGIGLGIGGVLFGGIIVGHFVSQAGMTLSSDMLHVIQEFGLILFVYTIGIQVGPGFFASLRVSGLRLNLFAVLIVIIGGTMRNFDLSPLMRQWIGFDKLANALQNAGESQSFPPYNIEKSDDNHYRITLALAGFRQEDLEIQLEGTRLSVKGTPEQPKEEKKWLHQGLMNQPFSLSFTLAENMEVSGATFVNGLLHIDLIRNEPEPIAAQRIAISERPALNS